MESLILQIRERIQKGTYKNEEHIRFSLIGNILFELGWDVWNPDEVNTEFTPNPHEDSKRVDIALFASGSVPNVFIEVKALGKLKEKLEETEVQLRNYNMNMTAPFGIITDGDEWRFYYALTSGSFSEKMFRRFSLMSDEVEDIVNALNTFLKKQSILDDTAETEAEKYLKLNQKQRVIADCLPDANRDTRESPYPSFPDALIARVEKKGYTISKDEAIKFIDEYLKQQDYQHPIIQRPAATQTVKANYSLNGKARKIDLDKLDDLRFTRILSGSFADRKATKWKDILHIGIQIAVEKSLSFEQIANLLSANLKKGKYNENGFDAIPKTNISIQAMDATRTAENIIKIAKYLKKSVFIHFQWREESESPYAGQEGIIEYEP
jgi:hypothetical protein